jgi:hypothetical protein
MKKIYESPACSIEKIQTAAFIANSIPYGDTATNVEVLGRDDLWSVEANGGRE